MSSTFLGAGPRAETSEAVVLGSSMATPYPDREPHATGGADAIRAASLRLARFAGNYDFDIGRPFAPWRSRIADAGDVNTARADPEGNRRRIANEVGALLAADTMPILLGGDDSVAEPFVAGWRDFGPITVVQLDAHLDFRNEVEGERHGYSSPMRRASEMECVERIVHIGQRGVGSARPADVQDSVTAGNTIVGAHELAERGAAAVAEQLAPGEPVVIVYDVDATDPAELPAVRAPVAGGPGVAQIGELISLLATRGDLRGLVVTEFEPELDPSGMGALSLVRLVCRAIDARLGASD